MYPPVDWVTPGLAVELVADLAGTRLLCRLQVDRNRMHWYNITINLILSVRYHTSGLFEAHFYLNFPTAMSFFFIDMGAVHASSCLQQASRRARHFPYEHILQREERLE